MTPSFAKKPHAVALALTALATIALAHPDRATADQSGGAAPVAWEIKETGAGRDIEHLAGTVDTEGALWLVVGDRPEGDRTLGHRLWLWRVDSGGEKTLARALDWQDAPAFQTHRAIGLHAGAGGVTVAIPTANGVYLVTRPDDRGGVTRRHVDAVGDAELIATATGPADRPAFVTTRGLVVFDESSDTWRQVWQRPRASLVLAATPVSPGRVGLVLTAVGDEDAALSVTTLAWSKDQPVQSRTTRLAHHGNPGPGTTLTHLPNGGYRVVVPQSPPGTGPWRLSVLDTDLNPIDLLHVDPGAADGPRSRLVRWGDSLAMATTGTDARRLTIRRVDARGDATTRPVAAERATGWQSTKRLDLFPASGGAYVVESARTLTDDASRTRSAVNILRVPGAAP